MEDSTKRLLRSAALEALNSADDRAALELLAMLNQQPTQVTTSRSVAALPAAREVLDGPAHDYHYWVRFIRENFIPFMTGNGRLKFTSNELLTWLENCSELKLTSGDMGTDARNRENWRNGVTNAMAQLKTMGVVNAAAFGKEYTIVQQAPQLMPRPVAPNFRE